VKECRHYKSLLELLVRDYLQQYIHTPCPNVGVYITVFYGSPDIMFPSVFASKGYRPRSHGLTDALMKKHVRHQEAIPIG